MIRLAQTTDIFEIMKCINDAKALLKSQGLKQWNQSEGYPDQARMELDISLNQLYVYEEDSIVKGCIVIMETPEPSYEKIYDGTWITDGPFISIHRIAVKKEYRNQSIGKKMMLFAEEVAIKHHFKSIRIDTHIDNPQMNRVAQSLGYTKCGTIILTRNIEDPYRVAYEKRVG